MTSTSDGSQAEEQAKAFARQYAKEFQEEKEAPNDALVEARVYKEGDDCFIWKARSRFKF
ncbi:MAG: hypothetical protein CM15mV31_0280 [uncultured marine virus]|nr:MAG: hypothetical protein CM15mV31_0280 [uncultured marine virus]